MGCTGFSICSAWAQQLWLLGSSTGSVVVVHGLSCSTACGILLEQGLNPCLLHWQADALPLNYQRSPSWNICLVIPVSPWLKAPTTLSIPGCCERVFIYLAVLGLGCGLRLSSLTRDRTHILCIGSWIPNHWTREVPTVRLLILHFKSFNRSCYKLSISTVNLEEQKQSYS